MAYATGTVTGGTELLGALTSFMAVNGWTAVDTSDADDLVYSSSGTNGKFPMIMRMTLSSSTNNPWKNCPYDPAKAETCLFVRGYHTWNVGGHSGTGEYGVIGPLLIAGDQTAGGPSNSTGWKAYRIDSPTGPTGFPYQNNVDDGYLIPFTTHCSNRKWVNRTFIGTWQADTRSYFQVMDVNGNNASTASLPFSISSISYHSHELVYDSSSGKWFVYLLTNSTASSSYVFFRYDMEENIWTSVAAVPWSLTGQSTGGGWICWDGADTLYMICNGAGTIFYKYAISTGTFTSLAALPVARNSNFHDLTGSASNYFYLSSSVSGLSSDVIFTTLNYTSTTLYCYNVNTNTWNDTAHGTPNLTLPQTFNNSASVVWDHQRYAYFSTRQNVPYYLYRMDLTNIAGGWTLLGNVLDASTASNCHNIWHAPSGKVRYGADTPTIYWIIGDSDRIVLVTKDVSSGHYGWFYFGRYQSRRRSAIMTTTSSVSSGYRVSIPVDDSSKYAAGDAFLIFDHTTGNFEGSTIYSVPDGTHIVANLSNSYGTGAIAGTDPLQTMVTGDSGIAVAASDPRGYKTDLEPAWYKLVEYMPGGGLTASQFWTSTSDGLGYLQPMEVGMLSCYYSSSYPYTNQLNPLSRTGLLGSPIGVYFLHYRGWPYVWPEDLIRSDGNSYLVFPQSNYNPLVPNPRCVVLGPIN